MCERLSCGSIARKLRTSNRQASSNARVVSRVGCLFALPGRHIWLLLRNVNFTWAHKAFTVSVRVSVGGGRRRVDCLTNCERAALMCCGKHFRRATFAPNNATNVCVNTARTDEQQPVRSGSGDIKELCICNGKFCNAIRVQPCSGTQIHTPPASIRAFN